MSDTEFDVVAIGNAIVDVLSETTDTFLESEKLAKGGMMLIDQDQATTLYGKMGPGIECSGGSAANTMVGMAAMGSEVAFVGRVQEDQLGSVFAHDIQASGVFYSVPLPQPGLATARCLILVTPDAQRTMNTFLGCSGDLGPVDVNPALIAKSAICYLEGYLWDPPLAKDAFRKAMKVSKDAGRKVALSLSDAFCVDRHRAEFIDLTAGPVDILFANEAEILSLFETEDFDTALQAARDRAEIVALTRGEKGCVIVSGDEVHVIDAVAPERLVDTTGAGDLFAAGFLHGLSQGRSLHDCGRFGALAASEIISHYGARPEADLKQLITNHG